eukprot:scaffold64574_cov50-Phaeocystis_antarctica.AAC.1
MGLLRRGEFCASPARSALQSPRVNLGSPRALARIQVSRVLNFNYRARSTHASARSVKLESEIVMINSHFTL